VTKRHDVTLQLFHVSLSHFVGWQTESMRDILTPSYLTNSAAPEPEGSSPCSQQPASDPYPEPGESTPPLPPQPISLRSIWIPSSHLCLGLPSGLLPSGKSFVTSCRESCSTEVSTQADVACRNPNRCNMKVNW
jgi:hypothetical protein